MATPINNLANKTSNEDISLIRYMRKIAIDIFGFRMRSKRQVWPYFDGVNVSNLIARPNKIITLQHSQGGLPPFSDMRANNEESVRFLGGNAKLLLKESYTSTPTIPARASEDWLYISAIVGPKSNARTGNTVVGARSGTSKTIIGYEHASGYSRSGSNTNYIFMALDANNTINNYYRGNVITLITGRGAGETSNIIAYTASTRMARVSPAFSQVEANAIYSIGDDRQRYSSNTNQAHYTTGSGYFVGTLHIPNPANSRIRFTTGDRDLVILDSPRGFDDTEFTTLAKYRFESNKVEAIALDGGVPTSQMSAAGGVTNTLIASNGLVGSGLTPQTGTQQPRIEDRAFGSGGTAQVFWTAQFNAGVYGKPGGAYIDAVDIFFKSAGTMPVYLTIRECINGQPSRQQVPGARSILEPFEIRATNAPNTFNSATATTFRFQAPVFLEENKDYAIALQSSSLDAEVYVTELGEKLIASANGLWNGRIAYYTGSQLGAGLYKSEQSRSWIPVPGETMMYSLHACRFAENGSVVFRDFISSEVTSNDVRPNVNADSMVVVSARSLLPYTSLTYNYKTRTASNGVFETTYKQFIPGQNLNFREPKFFQAENLDGDGDRSVEIKIDMTGPNVGYMSPSIYTNKQLISVRENQINNMPLANDLINIVDGGLGYNGANLSIVFTSTTGAGANARATTNASTGEIETVYLDSVGSGYFDNATITIVSASGSGANIEVTGETSKAGGPALARYISSPVVLADGFDAGDLRVYLTAIKPPESNIQVYYKIRNSLDPNEMIDLNWQKMEQFTSPYTYSTRFEPIEYEFKPHLALDEVSYISGETTYTTFNEYAIKIVLASSTTAYYGNPQLLDMRAIALPADPADEL